LNCDLIAPWYRWLEYGAFGRALQKRREAFLPDVASARRVLVMGDGDGRGLAALLRTAPRAQVDYVDSSARMLNLARKRSGTARVAYHLGNALDFVRESTGKYDLVVTHFFLDCLPSEELEQLLDGIRGITEPDARWLISEFRDHQRWSSFVVRGLYLFFGLTTGLKTRRLVRFDSAFQQAGFQRLKVAHALDGLLTSELWKKEGETRSFRLAGSAAGTALLDNAVARVESCEPPGKSLIGR
jgi:SAM-dependent methyltransferase